jgi:hypothetical protein
MQVRILSRRWSSSRKPCAPDEIAFHNGWISAEELRKQALKLDKTEYLRQLLTNLRNS